MCIAGPDDEGGVGFNLFNTVWDIQVFKVWKNFSYNLSVSPYNVSRAKFFLAGNFPRRRCVLGGHSDSLSVAVDNPYTLSRRGQLVNPLKGLGITLWVVWITFKTPSNGR